MGLSEYSTLNEYSPSGYVNKSLSHYTSSLHAISQVTERGMKSQLYTQNPWFKN